MRVRQQMVYSKREHMGISEIWELKERERERERERKSLRRNEIL